MALIKCPECGKEGISDAAIFCPYCNFQVNKYLKKQKAKNRKKIFLENIKKLDTKSKVAASIMGAFLIISLVGITVSIIIANQPNELEREAKQCFKILESTVGEVRLLDVVYVKDNKDGEEDLHHSFLFEYNQNGKFDYAYFTDLKYRGNGDNGGFEIDYGEAVFNNFLASYAQQKYTESLLGNISSNDENENEEVEDEESNKIEIIQLDISKIQ